MVLERICKRLLRREFRIPEPHRVIRGLKEFLGTFEAPTIEAYNAEGLKHVTAVRNLLKEANVKEGGCL